MSAPVRVLIVDDQSLVRSGFAMVLSVEDDIEVVGQAADGEQALSSLRSTPADIVLMDVQMPVMDGITATRQVVAQDLAKVIILTTFDREDYLFDALAAGASGFLLKNADPEDLVEAVRAVANGHALLAPEVTVRVIARLAAAGRPAPSSGGPPDDAATSHTPTGTAPSHTVPSVGATTSADGPAAAVPDPGATAAVGDLTAREREVLALMADGLSNTEIAQRLFLGESTVKTHVSHILTKTDSRDRVQAVVLAHRAGLARQD
ncbi:response regulator [Georgenia alba]|uniref:Response regulator n=1 Tax=Georgenia alba TaxID=2233858 RepID=A0ABW2Q6F3_9MICO